MRVPLVPKRTRLVLKHANDNEPVPAKLRAEVLISANLPITLVEIEVFAELLETLSAVNDNEGP